MADMKDVRIQKAKVGVKQGGEMTKQELAEKLVEIYTNSGIIVTASLGVFTFTYGEYAVDKYTPTELIDAAHAINPDVKTRYAAELNAAFAMYRYFKENPNLFAVARNTFVGHNGKTTAIDDTSHQLITYGAPGTGKSFRIKGETAKAKVFRTTFHPDSDYASFVGAYKPIMKSVERTALVGKKLEMADVESVKEELKKEKVISYEFVDQVFTQAYIQAWAYQKAAKDGEMPKRVYLVIEEINRGNCAQVFGDLFQLLDRNASGFSDYAIKPDSDFGRHIGELLGKAEGTFGEVRKSSINALYPDAEEGVNVVDEVMAGRLMLLPNNLFIRATMNTSDQSLFPMDSAFKRRWEWEYIPIKDSGKGWKIVADGESFSWWDFIETVNKYILGTLKNEDKQLGYFFARPNDDASDTIEASKFVNKVLFYLYNDVFKDYDLPKGFAKPDGKGKFAFKDFFLADGKPDEAAVKNLLTSLLAQPQ